MKTDRDTCFGEFDVDIPRLIKDGREKRGKDVMSPTEERARKKSMRIKVEDDREIPSDIYYMIHINCKYRKRIHELMKELRNINKKRHELEDKYATLKRSLSKVTVVTKYVVVKGDKIDEMFGESMHRHGCSVPLKRLAAGKYMFGTKTILAKIINGKLVIRVGGGYMSVDEFIETYGKQEMAKMKRDIAAGRGTDEHPTGKMGKEAVSMGLGDAKAMLLANIKTYGDNDGKVDRKSSANRQLKKLEEGTGINRRTDNTPKAVRSPIQSRNEDIKEKSSGRYDSSSKRFTNY